MIWIDIEWIVISIGLLAALTFLWWIGSRHVEIPIVCQNDYCTMRDKEFNRITLLKKNVEPFFEAWGQGSEVSEPGDEGINYCPVCGDLGIAYDPEKPRGMLR